MSQPSSAISPVVLLLFAHEDSGEAVSPRFFFWYMCVFSDKDSESTRHSTRRPTRRPTSLAEFARLGLVAEQLRVAAGLRVGLLLSRRFEARPGSDASVTHPTP